MLGKPQTIPSPAESLPGRAVRMPVPAAHFVNGHRLEPPFPAGLERAVFAMGCFWGAERKFWTLGGVYATAVGYVAGHTPNPTYREVCSGMTGHTEAVLVIFDPAVIGYDELLRVFWENHDPTQGMQQGNDVGTQVPFRRVLCRRGPASGGRGVARPLSGEVDGGRVRADHHGDPGRPRVLLRRGLSSAVSREESRRLLWPRRHRGELPRGSLRVTRGERLGERLTWVVDTYERVTFGTGFGAEGCVIIDAIAERRLPIEVFTLDTGLLFPETYALWRRLEDRYGVTIRGVRPHQTVEEQAAARGPRLWEREPDECCRLRKVEPLRRALEGYRAWITAIRREQSVDRADAPELEWNAAHAINKINPLVDWTAADVWAYVRDRDVPYNRLHDAQYPSIGCWPCTSPVAPGEDPRAGRWRGRPKTECGIHLVLNPTTGRAEAVRSQAGDSPRDLHDD